MPLRVAAALRTEISRPRCRGSQKKVSRSPLPATVLKRFPLPGYGNPGDSLIEERLPTKVSAFPFRNFSRSKEIHDLMLPITVVDTFAVAQALSFSAEDDGADVRDALNWHFDWQRDRGAREYNPPLHDWQRTTPWLLSTTQTTLALPF